MKKVFFLLPFAFCSVFLIACQSNSEDITLVDTMTEISISNSNGFGGLNETFFASFSKSEDLLAFQEILDNAKVKQTDSENKKPDYDLLVRYENNDTRGLHLILGNKDEESLLMYIGHEKDVYYVSSEMTNILREKLHN